MLLVCVRWHFLSLRSLFLFHNLQQVLLWDIYDSLSLHTVLLKQLFSTWPLHNIVFIIKAFISIGIIFFLSFINWMHHVLIFILSLNKLHFQFHTVGSTDIFAMSLIINFCLLTRCCFLFYSTSIVDSFFLSADVLVNGLSQDSSNTNLYGSL